MNQTEYRVPTLRKPVAATVEIPGSKSITNRALLLAALSNGIVTLNNVLFSADSRNFIASLERLGFPVAYNESMKSVQVIGQNGTIPKKKAAIYVGSAGTAARFITALLAAAEGEYQIDASEQMRARPMNPLLQALRELGAEFEFVNLPYALPLLVRGHRLQGGTIRLAAGQSSQFLSALLMIGTLCKNDLTITLDGELPAKPFVAMTLRMMTAFGVNATHDNFERFTVPAGQSYQSLDYDIEPDLSNAGYFFALAALTGSSVLVRRASTDTLQGDIKLLEILKQMGCAIKSEGGGIRVQGPAGGVFPGVDVDLSSLPDQTPTVAVLAAFATSPTIIRNVGFIRHHESNRIEAIVTELKRMGVQAEETRDGLVIQPGPVQAAAVETYDDHRMAMAFALAGLKVPGTVIKNPGCTAKTFENYFEMLEQVIT